MGERDYGRDLHDRPIIKRMPPEYVDLRVHIQSELDDRGRNPNARLPLLIGLDGLDGAGKSSLASWLAWQLEIPAVHLDTFLEQHQENVTWRTNDICRLLDTRLRSGNPRPIIVEGICLLEVLKEVGRRPDFLIFVEQEWHTGARGLAGITKPYFKEWDPKGRANYILTWRPSDDA